MKGWNEHMNNDYLPDFVDTDLEGFQAAEPEAEETAYTLDGKEASADGGGE